MQKLSSYVEVLKFWSFAKLWPSYAKVMKLSRIMPKLGSFAKPTPKILNFIC